MKSYSQFGEDLFLFDIFKKKKVSNGTFIEFGAWDGVHYSNCKLFSDIEWKGFFIEGNIERFNKLLSNYKNYKNINCINKFIDENYNLDKFVEDNKVKNLDILSIDIDGKDLLELKKLTQIRPKIIVVEFNMTIPFDVEFEDSEGKNGSSYLSIRNYCEKKNYELIHVTCTNLIFADKKFNNNEFQVWTTKRIIDKFNPTRIGFNNFGEILFFENKKILHQEIFKLPLMKSFIMFQPVPRFLRNLTDENGKGFKLIKIIYSHLVLLIFRPNLFIKKIFKKIK